MSPSFASAYFVFQRRYSITFSRTTPLFLGKAGGFKIVGREGRYVSVGGGGLGRWDRYGSQKGAGNAPDVKLACVALCFGEFAC